MMIWFLIFNIVPLALTLVVCWSAGIPLPSAAQSSESCTPLTTAHSTSNLPAVPPAARVYNVKAHRDMRPSAFLYINSQLDQTIDYEEGEAVRTFKWFSEEKIKSTA